MPLSRQKMNISSVLVIFLVIFMTLNDNSLTANGEKILVVSFMSSKSHKNVYEPLLLELANRGHSLTTISPIKSSQSHKNIKEIIGMTEEEFQKLVPEMNMFEMRVKKEFLNPFSLTNMFEILCNSYYELPAVKAILNEKFDLIIASSFMNECTFGLVNHFNTTSMLINPFSPMPWTAAITGTPSPSSFVPLPFFGSSHRMNFKERLINLLAQIGFSFYSEVFYIPGMEKLYRRHMGENTPSLNEIQKNVSLILTNSHFTLNYPRPFMPDIVEVGGMHCRPAKAVPKELEDFLNGSGKDGFIYFSMGSVIKGSTMPENFRKLILNAFSKLKQRVLWKWETETMPDLPKNVKLSKWLPQQDVLGHPNIKLFITHGGLLSTEEAVYHGVPLIGIPMFGDQDWNMKQSENNGFAITLDFAKLTEEKMVAAITRIINEPKFNKHVKELSVAFRDRPQKPLDTAVYWTQYIMRHKGAVHLRSPARDLNFFQYHSIDVLAVLFAAILLVLFIILATCTFLCRKLFGSKKKVDLKKKKK